MDFFKDYVSAFLLFKEQFFFNFENWIGKPKFV